MFDKYSYGSKIIKFIVCYFRLINFKKIIENLGREARNLQIGYAYFLENGKPIRNIHKFRDIVREDIIPLF